VVRAARGVMVALSEEQVAEVVRDAAGAGGLARLLAGLDDFERLRDVAVPLLGDPRCSRAALHALLVLVAFPCDGSDLELTAAAGLVGLSPGTTHRYVYALRAVGLLEQDPLSRRYRRPRVLGASAARPSVGGARGS